MWLAVNIVHTAQPHLRPSAERNAPRPHLALLLPQGATAVLRFCALYRPVATIQRAYEDGKVRKANKMSFSLFAFQLSSLSSSQMKKKGGAATTFKLSVRLGEDDGGGAEGQSVADSALKALTISTSTVTGASNRRRFCPANHDLGGRV